MAENSKIEWTDHTFNPWIGCQKISPGCDNCYAEALDKRLRRGVHWGARADRRLTSAAYWNNPMIWDIKALEAGKPALVFCASMADVFDNHKSIKQDWRDDLWQLIAFTPYLRWLLLTKRPQNIKQFLPPDWGDGYPNVWLGTTVENQTEADRRIPYLLDVPAKVRFLSCEPLLGPLDITPWLWQFKPCRDCPCPDPYVSRAGFEDCCKEPELQETGLHWVIAGGESGPKARPSHPDWFRALRDQCTAADVPFFFKQWGEWAPLDQIPIFCRPNNNRQGLTLNGEMYPSEFHDGSFVDCHGGDAFIERVGKKAAGRTLDGVTWDQMPEVTQ